MSNTTSVAAPPAHPPRPTIPDAIPCRLRTRCTHRTASLFHCISEAAYCHPETKQPVCPRHYPGTYTRYGYKHDLIPPDAA